MNPVFGLLVCTSLLQDTGGVPYSFDERFPPELTLALADNPDGASVIETLDWIRLHPYDLNSITREELLALPCVTLSGVGAILSFRAGGGKFRSASEMLAIPGGGPLLYGALAPFVTVGRDPHSRRSHRLLLVRLRATCSSPPDAATSGSPFRILSRLVLETGRGVEAGALFSKSQDERAQDALISGYALLEGLGSVTEVIAGDYEIQSGEGLVFWRGPSAVRGIWALRSGDGCAVVPHRSADENRYLRGMALAYSAGSRLKGIFFVSDRVYGAGLDSSGEATGFFRGEYTTESSLAKKDVLRESLAGARAEYRASASLNAGCTFSVSRFDRSFHPLDAMRFSGDRTSVLGLDVHGGSGIISYSGEYAVMRGGPRAWSACLRFNPSGSQIWIIRCRDYQPRFDNPHASGEGNGTATRNERGISGALRLSHQGRNRAEIFVDAFEHPWPEKSTQIPRRGIEMTASGECAIGDGNAVSARISRKLSYEVTETKDAWGREARTAGRSDAVRWGCEASCRAGKMFAFSTVLEFAGVSPARGGRSRGSLLGADIAFYPMQSLALDCRFFLFHTDGYGASLYAYESGIPGLLSIPPLYGDGLRWYVRARWTPVEWAQIVIRYACTAKDPSVTETEPVRDIPFSSAAQVGLQADIRIP